MQIYTNSEIIRIEFDDWFIVKRAFSRFFILLICFIHVREDCPYVALLCWRLLRFGNDKKRFEATFDKLSSAYWAVSYISIILFKINIYDGARFCSYNKCRDLDIRNVQYYRHDIMNIYCHIYDVLSNTI